MENMLALPDMLGGGLVPAVNEQPPPEENGKGGRRRRKDKKTDENDVEEEKPKKDNSFLSCALRGVFGHMHNMLFLFHDSPS